MNLCLSGGAIGADVYWGRIAVLNGHSALHYSFSKHLKYWDSRAGDLKELNQEELIVADPFLRKACQTIGKNFPKVLKTASLLRRNWYQIKDSEKVYAVSKIEDGQVAGGTNYAVVMFLQQHNERLPVYVFDQNIAQWFERNNNDWVRINKPPVPCGIWTGIGTRDLNELGRKAMREVFL